jgi:hypothetical protein
MEYIYCGLSVFAPGPEPEREGSRMQPKQPSLSIIITCFNYEKYISECIESALSQDYDNLEIIVVDDGSSDNSWEKISAYRDRITAARIENRGSLRSSLFGFSMSKGQFVHFLDADDVLCPDATKHIAKHLRADVSKIQFMLAPIDKFGKSIGSGFPKLNRSDESTFLIESIIQRGSYPTPPTSGNVYRRDVYEDLGDLSYERAIDGVAYLLAPFVGQVVSIDKVLGKYRIHDSNLSSFSVLTTDRMNGYADRFIGRLRHLKEIMSSRGISDRPFEVRKDYAYVLEMRTLGKVIGGQRPEWGLVNSYLAAVRRENVGSRQIMLLLFGIALFVLPKRAARELAAFRVNPSKLRKLRSKLKHSLVASQ